MAMMTVAPETSTERQCRGGYLERLLWAPPGSAFLAFSLQVEHQ
jgi:hypothetical protein